LEKPLGMKELLAAQKPLEVPLGRQELLEVMGLLAV
jgi:hypothetical protein